MLTSHRVEVLIDIRNNLENALTAKSKLVDGNIFSILDAMIENAYDNKEREQVIVLEDLFYCASHIAMGVFFKASAALPSVEDIAATFSSQDSEQ